jgi:hypothetical protein
MVRAAAIPQCFGSPAQPAEKGALEEVRVELIRLRSPVLARHRDARRMGHIGFDRLREQPARQPEAVAAGLVGDGDPVDRKADLRRATAPTMQKLQESVAVRLQLSDIDSERMTLRVQQGKGQRDRYMMLSP